MASTLQSPIRAARSCMRSTCRLPGSRTVVSLDPGSRQFSFLPRYPSRVRAGHRSFSHRRRRDHSRLTCSLELCRQSNFDALQRGGPGEHLEPRPSARFSGVRAKLRSRQSRLTCDFAVGPSTGVVLEAGSSGQALFALQYPGRSTYDRQVPLSPPIRPLLISFTSLT